MKTSDELRNGVILTLTFIACAALAKGLEEYGVPKLVTTGVGALVLAWVYARVTD
jgi:hypothetical protein